MTPLAPALALPAAAFVTSDPTTAVRRRAAAISPRANGELLRGEGAAPGWGDHLDAAPHSGLARPDLMAKPISMLRGGGQGNVSRGTLA